MQLRQSRSGTVLAASLALATTGTLRLPFFCHRRPWFRRLYAVAGVNHCFFHSAAQRPEGMPLASIRLRWRDLNSM